MIYKIFMIQVVILYNEPIIKGSLPKRRLMTVCPCVLCLQLKARFHQNVHVVHSGRKCNAFWLKTSKADNTKIFLFLILIITAAHLLRLLHSNWFLIVASSSVTSCFSKYSLVKLWHLWCKLGVEFKSNKSKQTSEMYESTPHLPSWLHCWNFIRPNGALIIAHFAN